MIALGFLLMVGSGRYGENGDGRDDDGGSGDKS